MTRLLRPVVASTLAIAVGIAAAGCSQGPPKKATIRGTVSYAGLPLHEGILRFVGPGGEFSMAPVQVDGSFIITDVVPGEVAVGFTQGPQSSGDSSGKDTEKTKKVVTLPKKYHDPATSNVKYTITADTTELNVDFPQ